MAITGTRIDAVGGNASIRAHAGPKARVIDLGGRTVLPGIIDSHTHLWQGAVALHGFNLATPEVYIDPRNESELVAAIKSYAAKHPRDKVLFGRANFKNDVRHEVLDRAVSDRPVVVHAVTEHEYWVNAKALALAGVSREPVADPGLEKLVVRDSDGYPTGVFLEAAMKLIDQALPVQPLGEQLAWLREAVQYLNRFGITSVTNATGSLAEMKLYAALRDRGQLSLRVRMALGGGGEKLNLTPEFIASLAQARTSYHDEWLSADVVKLNSDGDGGPPFYNPAELTRIVLEIDKLGYQIMTHAIGSASTHMVLDAYEEAQSANLPRDRRFRIEHVFRVQPSDVHRFKSLSVTASMQPYVCCWADSPEKPTNAWQTLSRNGANLAFGSDWPVSWPPNPFLGIQQAVMRYVRPVFEAPPPTSSPTIYTTPDERLSLEQAVAAYTRGGAFARFSENYIGTLESGKQADLIVLSQDIFTVPSSEISKTRVVMTMIAGRTVFDAWTQKEGVARAGSALPRQ
ncbi:MAG: amidohydrolase [Pyrinomonadaceae bacterium]|nr:amidohydrolase [Pyrinomonadaceae bacterium]